MKLIICLANDVALTDEEALRVEDAMQLLADEGDMLFNMENHSVHDCFEYWLVFSMDGEIELIDLSMFCVAVNTRLRKALYPSFEDWYVYVE